jgi:hypothetical protein
MTESLHNIAYLAAAGVILFVGVFVLRGVFKVVWKVVRIALILFAVLIIAGFLFGFLNISIH